MTLRMRIAAAAGLAVAIAVVAVSIAVYLGVRAELRDEVDASLHDRADAVVRFADRGDRRLPAVPPQPFGGPAGYVHLACSREYFETGDIAERALHFSPKLTGDERGEFRSAAPIG